MRTSSRVLVLIIAGIALLCPETHAAYGWWSSTEIEPGTVEWKNVETVVNFLKDRGYTAQADNITYWLRHGKIFWNPDMGEANGDTSASGDITIDKGSIRNTGNSKAPPFTVDSDFEKIVILARVLIHEKIHAHQNNLSITWSNLPGKTPHEYEGWTAAINAMDDWIKSIYKEYEQTPEADKAKRIKLLKQVWTIAGVKKGYISAFIDTNCQGYTEELDQWKLLMKTCGDLESSLQKVIELWYKANAAQESGIVGAPPVDSHIKTLLPEMVEPAHKRVVLRDSELHYDITAPADGLAADHGLRLVVRSNIRDGISAVLPADTKIGPPVTAGVVWATTKAVVVRLPGFGSVTLILPVAHASSPGPAPILTWRIPPGGVSAFDRGQPPPVGTPILVRTALRDQTMIVVGLGQFDGGGTIVAEDSDGNYIVTDPRGNEVGAAVWPDGRGLKLLSPDSRSAIAGAGNATTRTDGPEKTTPPSASIGARGEPAPVTDNSKSDGNPVYIPAHDEIGLDGAMIFVGGHWDRTTKKPTTSNATPPPTSNSFPGTQAPVIIDNSNSNGSPVYIPAHEEIGPGGAMIYIGGHWAKAEKKAAPSDASTPPAGSNVPKTPAPVTDNSNSNGSPVYIPAHEEIGPGGAMIYIGGHWAKAEKKADSSDASTPPAGSNVPKTLAPVTDNSSSNTTKPEAAETKFSLPGASDATSTNPLKIGAHLDYVTPHSSIASGSDTIKAEEIAAPKVSSTGVSGTTVQTKSTLSATSKLKTQVVANGANAVTKTSLSSKTPTTSDTSTTTKPAASGAAVPQPGKSTAPVLPGD